MSKELIEEIQQKISDLSVDDLYNLIDYVKVFIDAIESHEN